MILKIKHVTLCVYFVLSARGHITYQKRPFYHGFIICIFSVHAFLPPTCSNETASLNKVFEDAGLSHRKLKLKTAVSFLLNAVGKIMSNEVLKANNLSASLLLLTM